MQSEQNIEKEREKSPLPISGRFDLYRSSYWAASVAVLPFRYFIRAFIRKDWDNPDISHFDKHKYSALTGLFMYATTAHYAERTWNDMRKIFAEPLAWEFNKDEKDVGLSDFLNSKNTIVKQTMDNYKKYNFQRFGVNTAFFLPFILKPLFKKYHLNHPETGVDLGMGANAAYLFSDVLSRRITPFEELQALIDNKINHAEHFGDQINSTDLLDVYERHAAKGSIKSFLKQRGTPAWDCSMTIFSRMADLINQTYLNVTDREAGDFGFSKFIYLIGHGLIDPDHLERSRAYIEIVNRHGVKALRAAEAELEKGAPLESVLEHYSIHLPPVSVAQTISSPRGEETVRIPCGSLNKPDAKVSCREYAAAGGSPGAPCYTAP